VKGGLVVRVGLEDPAALVKLHAGQGFLVHGLDRDAAKVTAARALIGEKGLYGKVSADRLTSNKLPYVQNSVNLLLISDTQAGLADGEIDRVLAPRGVAMVGGNKKTKPVPAETDEWTRLIQLYEQEARAG